MVDDDGNYRGPKNNRGIHNDWSSGAFREPRIAAIYRFIGSTVRIRPRGRALQDGCLIVIFRHHRHEGLLAANSRNL
jgi:hypothetical protein